jgi:hypothetical protein
MKTETAAMADHAPQPQGQLPLEEVALHAAPQVPLDDGMAQRLSVFLKHRSRPIAIAALGLGALVWASWATHTLLDLRRSSPHIRQVQLADLVREFVQGEARSGASPDQITAETSSFLKSLNAAVARHAARGETVLLSNAIVAGNIPDITPAVRQETYLGLAKTAGRPALSAAPTMQPFYDGKGGRNGHGQ